MFSKELNAFKERYKIPSADKWAELTGVSKSTIVRGLNGTAKGIGVDTLKLLIAPYTDSLDEFFGVGAYSPEALEKEALKEKIETVIEVIENSEEIPPEPTQEIKSALEEVHEYITNEPADAPKCVACASLREMISDLKADKTTKDTWLFKLFGMCFALLGIIFVMLIVIVILTMCLVNK